MLKLSLRRMLDSWISVEKRTKHQAAVGSVILTT